VRYRVTIPPNVEVDDPLERLDSLGRREGPSYSRHAGPGGDDVRTLAVILDAETANQASRIVAVAIGDHVDPSDLKAQAAPEPSQP
jgi:hypothetical protein